MAQGIANIASACMGGIPATGAIARTATNIRSGAKTPVAAIVHSAGVLVMMMALAPLVSLTFRSLRLAARAGDRLLEHGRVRASSAASCAVRAAT